MGADLGLNPSTSGDFIRVNMPVLTEETRQQYIKQARAEAENARISIRILEEILIRMQKIVNHQVRYLKMI